MDLGKRNRQGKSPANLSLNAWALSPLSSMYSQDKGPTQDISSPSLFSSTFHISYGGPRDLSCEKICLFLKQITRRQQRQESAVYPYSEHLVRSKALGTCSDRHYASSLPLLTKPVWEASWRGAGFNTPLCLAPGSHRQHRVTPRRLYPVGLRNRNTYP